MCFGYKNLEKKIKISFRIKKSRIENNTFWKKLSERDYCVPEKGVWNVILYVPHFLKDIFGISPMIECNDMVQEAIAFRFRLVLGYGARVLTCQGWSGSTFGLMVNSRT